MPDRVVIIGPVYPFRGAISLCTMKLAEELREDFEVELLSFSRQYPKRFYPGGDDIDESVRDLAPAGARYALDVLNPLTWIREGLRLRRESPRAVILVWWVWLWAIPYLTILTLMRPGLLTIVQCHNIEDKEPRWWKRILSDAIFRRAHRLIVHSRSSVEEVRRRIGKRGVEKTTVLFLPVIPIGRAIPSREEARRRLGITNPRVALFFGNIRPFKALDVTLRAWRSVSGDVLLLVAGEIWFGGEAGYRRLIADEGIGHRVRLDLGYIPDAEVASYFAAADVVIASYRYENQSGVAMNAFHFGRPVIATAVGGLPEIIEDGVNGLLVPPEDPPALAEAVNRFFTDFDPVLLERGARASAEKFSWARYGSAVTEVVLSSM